MIELQEKREKTKKKVQFHQNLITKSSKKNKRDQKAKLKEDQGSKEKVGDDGSAEMTNEDKLSNLAVRKSTRISKIIGETKVEKDEKATNSKSDGN